MRPAGRRAFDGRTVRRSRRHRDYAALVADAHVLPFPSHDDREQRPEQEPEPRLREVIGDVLRDERHAQGRTLADVAERAAVSLPYLSEVERGRKDASSEVLGAICAALELPLPTLLDRAARRLSATARASARMFSLAA